MSPRSFSRSFSAAALLVWALAVGAGIWILVRYSNTAGEPAAPPNRWPAGASFRKASDRSTLLVFAHPQCPCTAASVEELAHIVADAREKLDVYLLFYAPEQQSQNWVRSQLWRNAEIIPGLHAIEDRNGVEVRRFHARTSGQTLLYDRVGHLQFSGGITSARGHAGGNDGRDAIVAFAMNGSALRATTPVFGCSLLGEVSP